ncbi:MAG: EscU/YscU/HrcU family type III secretion system export apparatus switch protein [Pseudomonadales bacterium]
MAATEEVAKRVIGLKYRPHEGVPTVVLKGAGRTADDVLNEAERLGAGPPVVKDEALLDRLYRLPVDVAIDPDLFELVAILLVHVYAVDESVLKGLSTMTKDS